MYNSERRYDYQRIRPVSSLPIVLLHFLLYGRVKEGWWSTFNMASEPRGWDPNHWCSCSAFWMTVDTEGYEWKKCVFFYFGCFSHTLVCIISFCPSLLSPMDLCERKSMPCFCLWAFSQSVVVTSQRFYLWLMLVVLFNATRGQSVSRITLLTVAQWRKYLLSLHCSEMLECISWRVECSD